MKLSRTTTALLFIVALGAFWRLWKIGWDLPYVYHPDEPVSINVALGILRTGDLNPHFFDYPSLYFYLNTLAYVPYLLLKLTTGAVQSRMDISPLMIQGMGVTFAPMEGPVILSRLMTAMFSMGSVGLLYFIGRRLTGSTAVGLAAALMMAVSPANASYGRIVTPDTYAVFFILASFAGTVLIYRDGKLRHYFLAGCMAGLAISCKYNAGLIVLPIVAAHFLRWRRLGFLQPGLYIAGLSAVFGFLLTTPYAILDYQNFMRGMTSTAAHYSAGHAGMEGDTLNWYLSYLWRTHGLVLIFSGLEIIRGVWRRVPETLLVAVYPVVYFALISQFLVRNDRTILLLTPFLFLLAALIAAAAWNSIRSLSGHTARRFLQPALAILLLLLIARPLSLTAQRVITTPSVAAKQAAREWILQHAPAGSQIAIESYAPFLPPDRYKVVSSVRMIDHPAAWYRANAVDYLVFSEGMFGRFYQDPGRYQADIGLYEELFREFPAIVTFTQGGQEIRISEVRVAGNQ